MMTGKRIALMLALLLALSLCAVGLAEAAPTDILEEYALPEKTVAELDLDGDGAVEQVSWETVHVDEYTDNYVLTVKPAAGEPVVYTQEGGFLLGVYAADLNGDGRDELFLTGDEASDDYITICLHLFNGRLEPAMFADCNRTTYNHGYDKYGYGRLIAIDGNRVTLSGSQDILGTWFGWRVFALADTGVFEFADDGKWVRDLGELDAEDWNTMAMTTIAEVNYTTPEGKEAALPVGTKLIVTASDKESADFVTQDGLKGTLSIYPNDQSWGYYVDGMPEDKCFDGIFYCD